MISLSFLNLVDDMAPLLGETLDSGRDLQLDPPASLMFFLPPFTSVSGLFLKAERYCNMCAARRQSGSDHPQTALDHTGASVRSCVSPSLSLLQESTKASQ